MSISSRGWIGLVAGVAFGAIGGVLAVRVFTGPNRSPAPVRELPVGEAVPPVPEAPGEPAPPAPATPPRPPAAEPPAPETNAAAEPAARRTARERGERVAQAQARLISDIVLKPFFEAVTLDDATRRTAGDLYADAFARQQQLQQAAMGRGDRTAAEVKTDMDALRDDLREQLRGVLTDQQLTAWEEFDVYSDRVLYEALLDGQLRMLAPDLTIESHQRVMAVFAEELERSLSRFESSAETYNLDNYNEAQYAGLVQALQRLRGELDTDQLGQAQGFTDQVRLMFDAMKTQQTQP